MAAKMPKMSARNLSAKTKRSKFQVKDHLQRAKAELQRLKAETDREVSGKVAFNFTPQYKPTDFVFKAPENAMEVSDDFVFQLKRDHDTANETRPEIGGDLKKLTSLNKSLASQSIISAASMNDMELLGQQVTSAQRDDAYCKKRLAMELNCALMQAVTGKHPEMVRALMAWGADPGAFKTWYPVSLTAVDVDCEEIVDILMAAGIDFSATCPYGTPLHSAARNGNVSMLRKLLAVSAADVNTKNDIQGATPLHTATLMKRDAAVELLLESGAEVNGTDEAGRTALHHAAMRGASSLINILVRAGADVRAVDGESKTPWMYASISMHTAAADKLIGMEGDLLELRFPGGRTYLHLAAAAGLSPCCEYLHGLGLDIGAVDDGGNTPLTLAVANNRSHIVRYLLSKDFLGANVNHVISGASVPARTALAVAMEKDHNTVNKMMLNTLKESGADVNCTCGDGRTLLMHHLSEGVDVHKVEWLIRNGASLNAVSAGNDTALMQAVKWVGTSGDVHPVRLLVEHNIDMRLSAVASDEEGVTPLVKALQNGGVELAALLFHAGASLNGVGRWLKTDAGKQFAAEGDENRNLCTAIGKRIPNCINLQDIARSMVLSTLGHAEVESKIEQLELPVLVKRFMDIQTYQRVSMLESSQNI